MNPQRRYKLTWVLLFTLGPLAAGLLLLAHREILSSPWRQLVEIGIVFIVCSLAEVWTRMNSYALLDNVPGKAKSEVIEIAPLVLLAPPSSRRIAAEDVSQIFGGPAELAASSGSDDSKFGTRLTPPSLYWHLYEEEKPSPSLN